ncbi:DUF429 domain-containing protein [Jeotgalibacillus haloalkalitolerans]|uniref:DUF429 domain-containing protein n=1 Tax=Jeotgalibacillus haloalkalitolerans TaxID=3104292 RepID=A0ABU5KI35_9BACL|nr:DUF429 domain-containing protein [Jeotgalibacillus sp. HH7-29]MDZ5710852.1 DUF429 domain-containing protein [Jeotgalibacillus sp. HH7-29]
MIIIGIDLSGPANYQDTVATAFYMKNDGLTLKKSITHASDQDILNLVQACSAETEVIIGIDAPLSYQDGGGDRPHDKALRSVLKAGGLNGSSIMTPTMTRMVYITLRGIQLTRMLQSLNQKIKIVEVHPGAAIGLRMGDPDPALHYKKDPVMRAKVFTWLKEQGMTGLTDEVAETTHSIDACGAALAVWHYAASDKQPVWTYEKTSAAHPFVMCC